MRVKVDENLPVEVRDELRAMGCDADTVDDEGLAGAADSAVLTHVQRDRRVLFTLDKGIANITLYPPANYAGIVLFRPPTSGRGAALSFVRQHLPALLQMDLTGHLAVVTERHIRIR